MSREQFLLDPKYPEEKTVDYGNKSYDHYKKLGWFPKSRRQPSVLLPESRKIRKECYYVLCTHHPLRCKECCNPKLGSEHDLDFLIGNT